MIGKKTVGKKSLVASQQDALDQLESGHQQAPETELEFLRIPENRLKIDADRNDVLFSRGRSSPIRLPSGEVLGESTTLEIRSAECHPGSRSGRIAMVDRSSPMTDSGAATPDDALPGIDPALLSLLCCPCDEHRALEQRDDGLGCTGCERIFPVVDGIPVILPVSEDSPQD